MTTHRPHPISGPWPYLDRTTEIERSHVPAHYRKRGEIPLIDREPREGSRIYDDPEDAILFDDCDRCDMHATLLTSLDPERFAALWQRMVDIERYDREGHRTATERKAIMQLYTMALLIERNWPDLDPWVWPWKLAAPFRMLVDTED